MNHYQEQPEVLWEPPYRGQFSRVENLRRFINRKHKLSLKDYNDLHKYSTEDWEFWQDVWEFTGVMSSIPPEKVVILEKEDGSLEFFPGTRLNYAENILRRNDDAIAITAIRETGSVVHYTRRQLKSMVRNVSNALRFYDVKPLDRVAAITTNSINAVVLALACATVGALYSTTAPDMGVPGILDRYRQITPKLLFSDTEILYAGKRIDLCQKLEQVSRDLTSECGLQKTIIFPSTITNIYPKHPITASLTFEEFLSKGSGPLVFEQLPFNHPLWILFSSEMQGKSLGMKVEVFDPEGRNIEDTFTPGELVCTRPHPSLPLYFWNDKDGKKYHSAYYEKYPGIWTQGDFLVVNPITKGIRILGRSDGVLNPSGVRFGSGEIYAVLERFTDKIDDSLCIGQRRPHDSDERVLLFLKLRTGHKLTPQFEQDIRHAIRTSLSRRHEPTYIFEVTEIPYTINNKKIEIAVKQVISGTTLKPSGTVANPGSLEQYKKYFELEKLVGETKSKPGPPKYDAKL
ncbi:hypothetical protein Clacol_010244 [Clathrus columnatus]|uniref:AMP-dependent synthetase/ligase domain-containing protein n=1 Tax=Clathrus columnatus TaxID=1419009 RepID=A0AAV5ATA4_9AGAM|nr:hypothetical protein Clacol_010244 [Clathrus columnatus]